MWRMIFAAAGLALLVIAPVAAQQQCTAKAPIEKCPNRYLERCSTDRKFQGDNAGQCLKLGNERRQQRLPADPAECQESAACRDERCTNPKPKSIAKNFRIEDFYLSCGLSNCPTSMQGIGEEIADIAEQMRTEVEKFSGILDIDITRVDGRVTLCKYTTDQMKSFKQMARADRGKLEAATARMVQLQVCSIHYMGFLQGADRGWQDAVRADLIKEADAARKTAAADEFSASEKVKKLMTAPENIDELDELFTLGCKQRPEAVRPSVTQTPAPAPPRK